jgi:hypothetical protein
MYNLETNCYKSRLLRFIFFFNTVPRVSSIFMLSGAENTVHSLISRTCKYFKSEIFQELA